MTAMGAAVVSILACGYASCLESQGIALAKSEQSL